MEAKGLQIGDWLNLSDVRGEIIPCKVVELHTDELFEIQPNDTACDIVGYDMVTPIPLTAAILEKNGFKRGEIIPSKFYRNIDNEQIMFCPYSWCYDIEYVRWNDSNVADVTHRLNLQQPMKCVHELQHALRLCGLTELADNFKV